MRPSFVNPRNLDKAKIMRKKDDIIEDNLIYLVSYGCNRGIDDYLNDYEAPDHPPMAVMTAAILNGSRLIVLKLLEKYDYRKEDGFPWHIVDAMVAAGFTGVGDVVYGDIAEQRTAYDSLKTAKKHMDDDTTESEARAFLREHDASYEMCTIGEEWLLMMIRQIGWYTSDYANQRPMEYVDGKVRWVAKGNESYNYA